MDGIKKYMEVSIQQGFIPQDDVSQEDTSRSLGTEISKEAINIPFPFLSSHLTVAERPISGVTRSDRHADCFTAFQFAGLVVERPSAYSELSFAFD